ncbi:GTP-binding protein [Cyclonatronum proteinivorum]|uniref:GTPase Obg n=2 Tax=Cyclonatronum proteinivorum TaxID=1457365 RepID=A0A345UK69_9BACT|nr:GTPase ObgE [Cyclonatronum proteinivorum]AXJ00871.1 GTP-binding protein [Cyclonatronum proteinivorum]
MRFADYAKIYLKAGNGGSGSAHFRREKYIPKGGPDGGDGGRGAHIILRGNANMNTLLDLRYKKYIKAPHGMPGGKQQSTGKSGEDLILPVPLGTIAYEFETRKLIGEVTEEGQELIIAKGGKGGLGNTHFKSSTNQTPRYAQPGEPGEEIVVEIELKLIADVGLVGFPNAGKSTLLAATSAARPKIADYPFTTLEPNLGVVQLPDYRSFVIADIPGIIEEAHQGKGLGLRFLRHIERNRVLLFVVAANTDIKAEYEILLEELRQYRADLLEKPRLLAISKADLHPGYELPEEPQVDIPYVTISAASGHNLDALKEMLWMMMQTISEDE